MMTAPEGSTEHAQLQLLWDKQSIPDLAMIETD